MQTDAFGRMRVLRAGALIDADLADTDLADTGYPPRVVMPTLSRDDGSTLTDWATQLREHARRALEVADTYDALAADGWELVPTQPAPGYYPPPLRRHPARNES